MSNLRVVPDQTAPCSVCELLAYWRAYAEWDREHARLWEGWPDDDEGEPPGNDELREQMPLPPSNWAGAVFEYTDVAPVELSLLRCPIHEGGVP